MSRFFLHPTPAYSPENCLFHRKTYIIFLFSEVVCTVHTPRFSIEKKYNPTFQKICHKVKSLQIYFKIKNNLKNFQFIYHNLNKIAVYDWFFLVNILLENFWSMFERGVSPEKVQKFAGVHSAHFLGGVW